MVWRHLRALGDSRGTGQPEDNREWHRRVKTLGVTTKVWGEWARGRRTLEFLGMYKKVGP